MENLKLNTIEEAIEDFKQGKFVIVVTMFAIATSKATSL